MNGILIVNKPTEHTSHDVVARVRGMLRERRIGHAGTLDPMATGVLPLLVGKSTRASQYLLGDKEYLADIRFGIDTDSQDITGQIVATSDRRPTRDETLTALRTFVGDIMQTPPMVSAVKVGGQKLYQLAQRGIEVERAPRPVHIHEIALERFDKDNCTIRVHASKGTYIRTLVHDTGVLLGCFATLTGLVRTRAEPYALSQAHTLEEVSLAAANGQAESLLLPVDSLFAAHPAVTVDARQETLCRHGNPFALQQHMPAGQLCRVYDESGAFLLLGVVKCVDRKLFMYTEKNFFEVS